VIAPKSASEPISAEMLEALREAWPNGVRLTAAWRLARDVDTLSDLLAGLPVDRDRLDPAGVAWARERRFVTLGPLFRFAGEEPLAA
jgi:hypothetical protein